MSERERLIWAAGFFDGEGCISVNRKSDGGLQRQASLHGTHEESVRLFHTIIGEGGVYQRLARQPQHKDGWTWVAASRAADRAIEKLSPYLIVKSDQATLLLTVREYIKVGDQRSVNRAALDEIVLAVKALNGNQKGQRADKRA